MKRLIIFCFAALALLAGGGCSDKYDDSALWKDIDQIYKDLNALRTRISEMQEQIDALQSIVGGSGAVTSVTQDADGNWHISYKDEQNVEHTIDVATQADTFPVIGMKQEGDVWYWTVTAEGKTDWLTDTDGAKIPVSGRAPELDVDADGYWTVFGERIKDADGNPVRAEGKAASVITGVTVEDGKVTFTLADGETVTAQIADGFNVIFSMGPKITVANPDQPLVIEYTLVGETETSVLSIEKYTGIERPVLDTAAKTLTVTFPANFDEGSLTVMFYDGEDNVIIKALAFTTMEGEPTGIVTVEDFKAFAMAANSGRSVAKYMLDGEVKLMQDLDLTTLDMSEYVVGGIVTPSTASANTNVAYSASDEFPAFDRIFNGNGHTLTIDWTIDAAAGNIAYGIFSYVGKDAEVKNLTVKGKITVEGAAAQGLAIGGIAGYAEGKITDCTADVDIAFKGSAASNISVRLGGIAGVAHNATVSGCTSEGDQTCVKIANTGNGTNGGFHEGGICGFVSGTSEISECVNTGSLSAATGRSGGICAVLAGGTVSKCVNKGLIEDDTDEYYSGLEVGYKRMGGLAGGSAAAGSFVDCVNEGNVFAHHGCRTGGFVGHNEATITRCENRGIILSDYTVDGSNRHGAGWACGYNSTDLTKVTECIIGGKVGDWSEYKDDPTKAPDATYAKAVVHGAFDPTLNGMSDRDDEFYAWTATAETHLAEGVDYVKYELTTTDAKVHVLTVDLSNPKVVLEAAMADEIVLNPNKNNNSNNGKNLRETLSETIVRRTAEGRNIVGGINTGFFNSDLGFPRACHVEYDEPLYVNNPYVRTAYTNHRPGFTLYTDRTVAFDNRTFSGFVKAGDVELEYYSINDTIVGQHKPIQPGYESAALANVYTSRFKKEPHPGIFNEVSSDALFIVAKSNSDLKINCGYIDGTVTAVIDGRGGASVEVPFVENRDEWVLQLTGDSADKLAHLKAGDALSIKAELKIGNEVKSMIMYEGSMYRFINNGVHAPVSSDEVKPATLLGADETGKVIRLVCIEGAKSDGAGMSYYQYYRVMDKLGCYNAIRFDGGGSTSMWVSDGGLVCKSCDSKGDERSCMNYMHVRILD